MSDLEADIVLCEDGREVVAHVYMGDALVRSVSLGHLDAPSTDEAFDDAPWRSAARLAME